ncbi:rhodanese-like domain-containing protein [Leptolyngbya cf. ectocarpi LEGE 11479]|uniref:Rhodanese-like domain-containing protein n=1 Tax=Leptolyngbya cf. ectocarpi LEGE 11479 TaxID=1828722 RepID=A0A928ZYN2_LEPEC|nr:rhodanese-like domain-containing protein [Leptolyngbya ectocarpi]MBE9069798.1 rhodanese-like domain-containing protein [Leptolyngbya cf. ectocarpi LEGE 11479]
MSGIIDAVNAVQEVAAEVSPVPARFEHVISAVDLKARLDWGEPALTIVDVRDRENFNNERIMGAISLPVEELTARAAEMFEVDRDIYVYGATDMATKGAATQLYTAGFERTAALKGGLDAWKAINGGIEGRNT